MLRSVSWSRCCKMDPILVVAKVMELGVAVAVWNRERKVRNGSSQLVGVALSDLRGGDG